MKKLFLFFVLLSQVTSLICMQLDEQQKVNIQLPLDLQAYAKFENTEITSENIFNLGDQIPTDFRNGLQNWISIKQSFFRQRMCLPNQITISQKSVEKYHKTIKESLRKNKLSNCSGKNIIIPIRYNNADYFIKMAGPLPRVSALLSGKYEGLKKIKLPLIIEKKQTFLTPSMYGYHLRLKEIIKNHGLKYIALPETYIVDFNNVELDAHDENCLIVQKKIAGMYKFKDHPHLCAQITPPMLKELCIAIKEAAPVQLIEKLYLQPTEKKLYLCGLKESCREPAGTFFNPQAESIFKKIATTFIELNKFFEEASAKSKDGHDQEIIKFNLNMLLFFEKQDPYLKVLLKDKLKSACQKN